MDKETKTTEFREKLRHAINYCSMENGSDTPDFLLAQYLADCLDAYDKAVTAREKWYGRGAGNGEAIIGPDPTVKP